MSLGMRKEPGYKEMSLGMRKEPGYKEMSLGMRLTCNLVHTYSL